MRSDLRLEVNSVHTPDAVMAAGQTPVLPCCWPLTAWLCSTKDSLTCNVLLLYIEFCSPFLFLLLYPAFCCEAFPVLLYALQWSGSTRAIGSSHSLLEMEIRHHFMLSDDLSFFFPSDPLRRRSYLHECFCWIFLLPLSCETCGNPTDLL